MKLSEREHLEGAKALEQAASQESNPERERQLLGRAAIAKFLAKRAKQKAANRKT
jgi:hypothetical protein